MSDCACLYSEADGDSAPDFYSDGWATARTEHRCVECRRGIWPGDRYHRFTGKWDGETQTFATCVACQDVRASLYCGGSWAFGGLWEDVTDQLFAEGGVTGACLAKLATVEGKRYLSERWWAWVNAHSAEVPHAAILRAMRGGPRTAPGEAWARGVSGGGLL